jgi:hypothetical protein
MATLTPVEFDPFKSGPGPIDIGSRGGLDTLNARSQNFPPEPQETPPRPNIRVPDQDPRGLPLGPENENAISPGGGPFHSGVHWMKRTDTDTPFTQVAAMKPQPQESPVMPQPEVRRRLLQEAVDERNYHMDPRNFEGHTGDLLRARRAWDEKNNLQRKPRKDTQP